MPLITLFFICLGLFGLLRFGFLPRVVRRLNTDSTPSVIKSGAFAALLAYLSSILLIGTLTSGVIIILVIILNQLSGITSTEVGATISTIQIYKELLTVINIYWGGGAIAILVLSLGIYSYQRGKLRVGTAFQNVKEREFERLKQEFESGDWKELPPTQEMEKVQEEAVKTVAIIEAYQNDEVFLNEPESKKVLQTLKEHLEKLREAFTAMDFQRRLNLDADQEDIKLPPPKNNWEKVQTFFISQGLLSCLNRGARVLSLVSLILVIPSLLGITSSMTGSNLEKRIEELNELQVTLSTEEARDSWKLVQSKLENETTDLTPEDEEALDELAQQFEKELVNDDEYDVGSGVFRSYHLRTLLTRDKILSHGVKSKNKLLVEKDKQLLNRRESITDIDFLEKLDKREKAVVKIYDRSLRTDGPRTEAGKRVRKELENIARKSPPSFMSRIKNDLKSFQRPVRETAIKRTMISQIIGEFTNTIPGEFSSLIPNEPNINELKKVARQVHNAKAEQFLTNVAEGKSINESIKYVRMRDPSHPFSTIIQHNELKSSLRSTINQMPHIDSIIHEFDEIPPRVFTKAETLVNTDSASKALNRFKNIVTEGVRRDINIEHFTDSLAGYEDWFPGQAKSASTTQRGQLLRKWAKKNIIEKNISKLTSMETGAFRRASSFVRLRGFSRVGGVLIGRPPSNAPDEKLDIRDIGWEEVDSSRMCIKLYNAEEVEIASSIPHKKSLIWQALLYAADSRPTTVTMAKAEPLQILRIHTHPVLEDTPLGYRVIELDRFVDKFTANKELYPDIAEARSRAEKIVTAHQKLYFISWANRILSMDPKSFPGIEEKIQEYQDYYQNLLDEFLNDFNNKILEENALFEFREYLDKPNHSPLTVKKEFFDAGLVQLIIKCAANSDSLDAFIKAFKEEAQNKAKKLAVNYNKYLERYNQMLQEYAKSSTELQLFLLQNDISQVPQELVNKINLRVREKIGDEDPTRIWFVQPPTFEIWSGVREREFSLTLDEIVQSNTSAPDPIVFMLQVAFTSEPEFSDDKEVEEAKPWEFPSLKKKIHETVLQTVDDLSGNDVIILHDVYEFTMLQRLFRLAFDGRLGEDFPVEKLEQLVQTVAPKIPNRYRTIRWNARPDLLSAYLKPLGQELSDIEETLLSTVKDPTDGSFAFHALSQIRWQKEQVVNLETAEAEAHKHRIELLQSLEKNTMNWRKQWKQLWQTRREKLGSWITDWEEVVALQKQAKEILEDEDVLGTSTDAKQINKLNAARIIQDVTRGIIQNIVTILELYNAFRIDVDEKQALEENEGLVRLPPPIS